jgi:hypothetical protein
VLTRPRRITSLVVAVGLAMFGYTGGGHDHDGGERIDFELCDNWRRDIQDEVHGTLFREPSVAFMNNPG